MVLSAAKNALLTEIEPGTPMGDLMRRYWHPITASSLLGDEAIQPVRLLGEDLVLFRGQDGTLGLVGRHCPHRRADLAAGFVEGSALRCSYHGWAFDPAGSCVAQPYEDVWGGSARLRKKSRIAGYPVRELAGLVWAYLGPGPAPELPCWEPFSWSNGFAQIVLTEVPCNWLQCQENSIDPVHFEWLHDNWGAGMRPGTPGGWSPQHVRIAFDEFEYGFTYRRTRSGQPEDDDIWTVGRVCLWPAGLFVGDHFEWRVPIDNGTTLSVSWMFERVPEDMPAFHQKEIPAWYGPLRDEQGRLHDQHILNQDFVAWLGQGRVTDRTKENLGRSDQGITMMRNRLLQQLDVVASGQDPKGVIRDPASAACIELPISYRENYLQAPTRDFIDRHRQHWASRGAREPYLYQAGQPDWVRAAYDEAMGVSGWPAG